MQFLQQVKKSSNLLQAIEQSQGSLLPETLSSCLSLIFQTQLLRVKDPSEEV